MATEIDLGQESLQKVGPIRFRALRIIWALVLREASSRFGRSTGGYLWAFAEPAAGILLLSVAFGYLLRSPPIGDSFFLFYTSGVVPLMFFNTTAGQVASAVAANRGLLTYPVVTILDVVLARTLLELITYSTVFAIICTVAVNVDQVNLNPDFLPIIGALLLTAVAGMMVGMINCLLFVYFPTWRSIWRVLTRPLLIVSGVLFTYEDMPAAIQSILWYNPLLQIIGLMRGGIYESYDSSYVSLTYLGLLFLALIAAGAWLIRQNESRLIQQ